MVKLILPNTLQNALQNEARKFKEAWRTTRKHASLALLFEPRLNNILPDARAERALHLEAAELQHFWVEQGKPGTPGKLPLQHFWVEQAPLENCSRPPTVRVP